MDIIHDVIKNTLPRHMQSLLTGSWLVFTNSRLDLLVTLGGHSLSATRVISRINKTFEAELSPRSLFEAPTVAEIAVVNAQNQATKARRKEVSRMLTDLEALSDDEPQRLLAE